MNIRLHKNNLLQWLPVCCFLLMALSVLSCKKRELTIPENVGTIRFESSSYTIENNSTDTLNVVLPLSLPLEEDARVVIAVDKSSTINKKEFVSDPVIPVDGLVLNLAKGATLARLKITSLNNFEGNKNLVLKIAAATGGLSISNTNTTTNILIKGDPIILPEIKTSVTGIAFGNLAAGSTAPSQSYNVWGIKLTSGVQITASANFQLSLDDNTYSQSVSITAAAVDAGQTTVYVRAIANTGINQPLTGTITHTTAGAPDVAIAVSAVEYGNAAPGILIFKDDFEYGATAGNLKAVTNTWPVFSGSVNPIKYVVPGLSYIGYAGSNKGGAVLVENGSGSREDNSTAFTAQNSGTIYVAQMVKITAGGATTDFFTSLRDPANGYYNRVYVRDNGGSPQIGIAKSDPTVFYSSGIYSYGNTYLVITKYDFNTGISSLFVLSGTIPTIEPPVPDAQSSTGTSPASVVNVCLRQNTTILTATYDGLRVATSWKQAVGL